MKIRKLKKNKKTAGIFFGFIVLGATISALAVVPFNNESSSLSVQPQQAISLANQTKTLSNVSDSLPKVNDKNGKLILFGSDVIRLNNKLVYENNQIVSKSVLGVYDQWNTALQTINLNPDYNNLSQIDNNDLSKGIVVSNETGSALWFGINITNKKIINDPKKINVPDNTISVGANFNVIENKKSVNKPVIVSAQTLSNDSGSYYVNISVTNIDSLNSYSKELDLSSVIFNNIKFVDSFAINNNLYLGINLYNNSKLAGSELILLSNGNLISGGPSFVLPFQLNSLVYDQEHNSIYAQYFDLADNSLRMWGFDVNNPDSFAQLGTIGQGNVFSQMVYVKGYGVASLNQSKNSISLFQFKTNSFINAPDFTDAKIIYSPSFANDNTNLISNLIFNPNTNNFSLFYAADQYVDGIITWSFNENQSNKPDYQNIVPVHIDYQKLINAMQDPSWKSNFASVYAENNLSNSFNSFLIIPSYYKNIQNQAILNNNKSFSISYQANENLGMFTIDVASSHDGSSNVSSLLVQSIGGFSKVTPQDLTVNYTNSSPLLDKTPSEVQSLLNDPKTSQQTKNEVFKLFGINSKYQVLPFNVSVIDSNVLGKIKFQIEFPTIKNSPLIEKSKIISNRSGQDLTSSGPVSFDNTFKISIEHWFIPVVTVASIILLILILTGCWFLFGRKIYWRIAAKSKERLELQYLHLNSDLESSNNEELNIDSSIEGNNLISSELRERFKEEKPFAKKAIKYKNVWKNKKNDPGIQNFHEILKMQNLNWIDLNY